MGYMPTIPQMPRPVPLDERFADVASKATSGTVPRNVLKTWFNAYKRFKHSGPEYIEIWREAYLDLCVEDGYIEHQWTSEKLMTVLDHYFEVDKLNHQYHTWNEYYDPSKLNYKPLAPPPKKP
jgi:hypothetical protein